MSDFTKTLDQPGRLVRYRDRRWIVLPSEDPEIVMLKPLGGSDHEITAFFKPFARVLEKEPEPDIFPEPTTEDIGDFQTAKLLFEASRLSFRNANGPFRSFGKLSFRPRSYQVVPLVMALKQSTVRMLIADDVGIGKTIETLLILKELMERGEVRKFAVICPPHLCEQWQQELKDKLDIQAEIIRSSTVGALDRVLPDDRSVFYHFPYQVISIDYIKSDRHRDIFLRDCPEMVIVDEVHTCALPSGATSKTQQQRYHLIHDVAQKPDQHLVMLTATPHSGKDDEFKSLLGLLKPEFGSWDLSDIDHSLRKVLAAYYIQRKRENIRKWAGQTTKFPERDSREIGFKLSPEYLRLYYKALDFAQSLTSGDVQQKGSRVRYWAALALLRGIMSSPASGIEMLKNRQKKKLDEAGYIEELENPNFESIGSDADTTQQELLDYADLKSSEIEALRQMQAMMEELEGPEKDHKVRKTVAIIREWVKEGFFPIIFCRFIATAEYVGRILKEQLPQKYTVRVITSDLSDEQRKEAVERLGNEPFRVLVATDCLSEGINLQDYFTAVLHYDLPWNPNRIEQREGRVDRFGQTADMVKTWLLWGEDNPIDAIVLQILIRKVRNIQKSIGVSIPIGEDNQSIMDAILKTILLDPRKQEKVIQGRLDFGDDFIQSQDARITRELEAAREKALQLRDIFTHSSVSAEDIEQQLKEVDESIGDVVSVEDFVTGAMIHLGVTPVQDGPGYRFNPLNLPAHLKTFFPPETKVLISFESPTPKGYRYIGRNHRFTEQLCQFIMALAFEGNHDYNRVARASVVRTDAVRSKTTLVQFRVRNVIREKGIRREVISEEMYLWGYTGSRTDRQILDYPKAKVLLKKAHTIANLSKQAQESIFLKEGEIYAEMKDSLHQLAEKRAENLLEAHGRFRNLVGGKSFEKVYPILPPDIMGIYILLPPVQNL